MDRLGAMQYALATQPMMQTLKIDLRLAAYIAAMDQMELSYSMVKFGEWWSARCQLGMLLGDQLPALAPGVLLPAGKRGERKVCDAKDFCDLRYKPHPRAVRKAMYRLRLLQCANYKTPEDLHEALRFEERRSL